MSRTLIWTGGAIAFGLLALVCLTRHVGDLTAGGAGSAGQTPAGVAGGAPSFSASRRDGRLILRGALPSDAAKAPIVARAHQLYGTERVVDSLTIAPALGSAAWIGAAPAAIPPPTAPEGYAVALDTLGLTLSGTVASTALKDSVVRAVSAAHNWDLPVIDRLQVGGAPPGAGAAPLQVNLDRALAGRTIEFETASDVLTAAGRRTLDDLLPLLRAAPDDRVEIGGHTDARGAADANLALSQRRAEAVRRYLVGKGVAADRLTAVGYGETQPLTAGTSPAELRRNRRISFQVK